jgi:HPt (histidine-containing phosphotransfer) domain-containing protein
MNFRGRWHWPTFPKPARHSSKWTKLCAFSTCDSLFLVKPIPCPMSINRASKDLAKLSSLGHFLKGSSAALGVSKVQASCEKIQHYGQLRDEEEGKDLSRDAALDKIHQLLGQVKAEYSVAETWLKKWYADHEEEKLGP